MPYFIFLLYCIIFCFSIENKIYSYDGFVRRDIIRKNFFYNKGHEKPRAIELLRELEGDRDIPASSYTLKLTSFDIRLNVVGSSNYVDLIINKKPGMRSVMLTNYYWTEDKKKVREYGLRTKDPNGLNEKEKRLYKNAFIGGAKGLYFLIDSTPEKDNVFGTAFRLRLPQYVMYGYQKTNQVYGLMRITKNTKLNIRVFAKRYCDYTGAFYDNPVIFSGRNIAPPPARVPVGPVHPVLSKIGEISEPEFFSIHLKFDGIYNFFNSFLMKKYGEKKYKTVDFNNNFPEHLKAMLLSQSYKNLASKTIEAAIHFKYTGRKQTYYITAVDKSGIYSSNRIVVHVPSRFVKCKEVICGKNDDCIDDSECYQYRLNSHPAYSSAVR